MLRLTDVGKSFGGAQAVAAASFSVVEGELVCLLGPSGCGKSTLLRMIAGLTEPDTGVIEIAGQDVTTLPANRRPTAMVFQSHALWNHMTVERNVSFGLRVRGLPRTEIADRVAAALDLVGLSRFGSRRPAELSGGQAQRVALARCLVVQPKVLLMDEPFSALDAHLRANLREELKALQRRLTLTVIFVTHDQEEAMELADRIVVMDSGRIEQIGRPNELYLEPQSLTVARFIGQTNICETTIAGGRADWFGARLLTQCADGPATILSRPEDLVPASNGAPARVDRVTDLGPMLRLHLTTDDGGQLVWLCPRSSAPQTGSRVSLVPGRLQVYRNGERIGTAEAARPSTAHARTLA
ncbi:MAG: ABC transporter ATP-binding protein [Tabrizicola sp.]|nr:ABC transporter ATP-binding protein [Tabrizicola sp.]